VVARIEEVGVFRVVGVRRGRGQTSSSSRQCLYRCCYLVVADAVVGGRRSMLSMLLMLSMLSMAID
jgi:hypothetical protein